MQWAELAVALFFNEEELKVVVARGLKAEKVYSLQEYHGMVKANDE